MALGPQLGSERRTAATGIAKPTPSPPPPVDSIWELMPSTRPRASTSGPPELPWLMAASVWIAPGIWKLVSESIERFSAEMMPTESDWGSPKGLPMAATGEPTRSSSPVARASGARVSPPDRP